MNPSEPKRDEKAANDHEVLSLLPILDPLSRGHLS